MTQKDFAQAAEEFYEKMPNSCRLVVICETEGIAMAFSNIPTPDGIIQVLEHSIIHMTDGHIASSPNEPLGGRN